MDDLPQTQTQEEYIPDSQTEEEIQIRRPWGRLCAYLSTMLSVDLSEATYTFGRAPDCDIFVEKANFSNILNISKVHFKLHRDVDDLVYITDFSKNGTFVNGSKLGRNVKQIIYNDDVIAVGQPSARIYTFSYNINREDHDYPTEMLRKYFISKKIGRGGFGEVRLAHDKCTFEKYAVKKICKARASSSSASHITLPPKIKTEVDILTSFSYTFIIQMKEVYETDKDVFLMLEYMPGGELTKRILSATPFLEDEVKFVFYQILLAMRYLHLNGVTHRDLKPENILLLSDSQYPLIKVTDFGLSKILDQTSLMETVCGTINYAAPEVLNCFERYNKKVDIWSLGVILFYMLSKTQPFMGGDRDEVARNILTGKVFWDSKAWIRISASAKDLTRSMLTVNSERRISTAEIFKHDWIEKDASMRYKVEQFLSDTFEESDSEDFLPVPKRPRLSMCN